MFVFKLLWRLRPDALLATNYPPGSRLSLKVQFPAELSSVSRDALSAFTVYDVGAPSCGSPRPSSALAAGQPVQVQRKWEP